MQKLTLKLTYFRTDRLFDPGRAPQLSGESSQDRVITLLPTEDGRRKETSPVEYSGAPFWGPRHDRGVGPKERIPDTRKLDSRWIGSLPLPFPWTRVVLVRWNRDTSSRTTVWTRSRLIVMIVRHSSFRSGERGGDRLRINRKPTSNLQGDPSKKDYGLYFRPGDLV